MCWANSGAEPVLPVPAESAIAPAGPSALQQSSHSPCVSRILCYVQPAGCLNHCNNWQQKKETVWHTVFHDNISFVFPYLVKSSETSLSSSSDNTYITYTTYYVQGCAPIMLRCEWRKFIKSISQSLPFMSMYGLHMRPVSDTCHLREMLDWFWLF